MEKGQGQGSLDLIHLPSLKELINPVRDRLANTLHLLGTVRKFLTTRHLIVEVSDGVSSLPVRTDLERIFEIVTIILESTRDFLIGGSTLLELLHLPSREELINNIGSTLTNTLHLLGTLSKLLTTHHLVRESMERITNRAIGIPLVRILFIRGELVKDVHNFMIVGDDKLGLGLVVRLGLGLVVRLFKNLTL